MQTVKFVYSGSATRKLTVMGRDQVIVSGDDNSTQFIFSFPDSYKDYSKEIIWSGFYIKNANDEEIIPRYPIINNTFYVPQEITLPNSGKEINFQIILTKPKDDEDESSFDIMETSLEFQVYVSKCAKFESIIASTDTLSLLLQKAYVSSAYDVNQEEDRPIITFSSLEGQTSKLILDMPYLDESGTIAQQFLPPGSEVKVWHVDYEQDIYDLTFSNPPDLAIIDVGTEGSQTDYAGNIFVKTNDEDNTWTLIYSKYTTDQIQPIYDDIQAITDQADALEARVDTAEDDIDALEGRMDTAESDIDSLEGRMDTAEGDIDSLEGRMDTAEGDIDSLEGRMDTAEGDIDALEGRMDTAEGDINSLEERMDTAETNISTNSSDIDALEGRMDTAESNISTNAQDIDSLEGRMDTAETNISTNASDIDALEGRMDTAETNISTNASDIDQLEGRMDTAETNISTNASDIDSLEGRMDTAESNISTNQQDIDSLEGRMDTAEGDIDTLESGKVDKTTTVNGHALSSDVTVTKADVGLGNADNTQDIDKPISTATQYALDQKLDDSQLVTSWSDPVSDTNIPSEKLTKDTLDNITGDISGHIQDKSNPHEVTKAQVGLGNVDNTSDLNKPISTATQSALDLKLDDSQLVTQWTSTVLDTNIPSEKLVSDALDTKVDKVQGYGLSQNDLTDALKQQYDEYDTRLDTAEAKLDTIESGAEVNVQSDWAEASVSSDQYILNKPTLGTAQAQDYVQVSAGQSDQGKLVALNNDGVVDGSALPAFVSSVNTRTGAVTLTKSDVGLTNTDDGAKAPVDNLTSNTNPPLATTVQAQVNDKMNQLPSTLTGGKILVSVANDRDDIQESSYDTSKLGYLDNVTSDIQTQINSKVTANAQLQSGATKCKITYDTKGLVTAGQDLQQSDIPNLSATKITSDKFDKQRLPTGTGIIYEGSFTGDGVTSSWTYPVTPYDTNVASISIRDSNGYDVRFGVQYGTGVVTITSAEPLDNGQSFTFKLIAPVA